MIELVARIKLQSSVSFRALQKILVILEIQFELITNTPSAPTLLNWIKKIGYYELTKEKNKSNDWIILLDHSIQLGKEKVFVVLGIQASEISYNRALNYTDLSSMLLIVKEQWNGVSISNYLIELQKDIGTIIYAVGDYGSDIKKGLELAHIPHVRDLTHEIASIIEKLYKKDPAYEALTKKMGEMRMKLGQTEAAHIIPPNQRQKSRFLNIDAITNWASNLLKVLEQGQLQSFSDKRQKQINWIKSKRQLINELTAINKVKSNIEQLVKNKGLHEVTIIESIQYTKDLTSEKGKVFAEAITAYLESTYSLSDQIKMICSSDILESAFGKYKSYLSQNPMACMTDLVLCIPAFTSSLSEQDIITALETVKIKQIQKWKQENIGKTLFSKRRELFKKAA